MSNDLLDSAQAGGAVIRGGALRTASLVGGILLTLASVPLMARHLGVVDFGRYVLATSMVALIAGFTEGGVATLAQRQYAVREGADRDRFFRNLVGMRLALSAVAVLLSVVFALVAGYDGELVAATAIAALGTFILFQQGVLLVPLINSLRFGWVSALDFARVALLVALTIAAVVLDAGLLIFVAILVVSATAVYVWTAALARKTASIRASFDRVEWRALLRITLPYFIATAFFATYFRVSIVLLSLVGSEPRSATSRSPRG